MPSCPTGRRSEDGAAVLQGMRAGAVRSDSLKQLIEGLEGYGATASTHRGKTGPAFGGTETELGIGVVEQEDARRADLLLGNRDAEFGMVEGRSFITDAIVAESLQKCDE